MTPVEHCRSEETPVEGASGIKRQSLDGLAPEVSHHQQIGETAPLEFNSRRLHHLRSAQVLFVVCRLGFDRRFATGALGTTPAASTDLRA